MDCDCCLWFRVLLPPHVSPHRCRCRPPQEHVVLPGCHGQVVVPKPVEALFQATCGQLQDGDRYPEVQQPVVLVGVQEHPHIYDRLILSSLSRIGGYTPLGVHFVFRLLTLPSGTDDVAGFAFTTRLSTVTFTFPHTTTFTGSCDSFSVTLMRFMRRGRFARRHDGVLVQNY